MIALKIIVILIIGAYRVRFGIFKAVNCINNLTLHVAERESVLGQDSARR